MIYDLKYYGNFPTDNTILISCSIFKLKKYYNVIDIYIDGLLKIINTVIKKKYHIIIFFDHSIKNDNKFINIFNKYVILKNVLFCEYFFKDYIDEYGYHKNIFGMYIRLLPIFIEEIKFKYLYISDIDLTSYERQLFLKINIKKFIKSDYDIAISYKIGYEYKYNDLYNIPNTNIAILSNIYFKSHHKHVEKLLFDFLNKLNNNDIEIKNIIDKKNEIYINFYKDKKYVQEKDNNVKLIDKDLFSYGVDELFTNKYLMPYFIHNKFKIGVFYIYDSLVRYTYNILDINLIPLHELKLFYNNIIENIDIKNKENKKFAHIQNPFLNKINYVLTKSGGNTYDDKLINFYIILKRYIKYIQKLLIFYPKINNERWIKNLLLHKKKGFYRQIFSKKFNIRLMKKYIKLYPFDELL